MSFLKDLFYFGPGLGMGRGLSLAWSKLRKREAKRRVAAVLARPESDELLLQRLHLPSAPPALAERLQERWTPFRVLGIPSLSRPEGVARAKAVFAGRQYLFGVEHEVAWPPRWNWRWDGEENQEAFRDDRRTTWEIQRLQGLLPLAWAVSGGPGFGAEGSGAASADGTIWARRYLEALRDFSAHHPGPGSPAWESALELGLRLISFVQAFPLVSAAAPPGQDWIEAIRLLDRTARWLRVDLSLDKVVRGNHLLGELAGLVAVGHLLPEARPHWWASFDPQTELEREILVQFHPDGVSVEQSLPYEKFVLEFLVVTAHAAALGGRPFSTPVLDRLRAGVSHLHAVTGPDDRVPPLGDCDSGGGAQWGEPEPADPKNLFERAESWLDHRLEPPGKVEQFVHGGHLTVRTPAGGRLLIRGGPFGWKSTGPASHSHCDWMSPLLHWRGEPVWVDPGVWGYGIDPALRAAERHWDGHNGLALSPSSPPFPDGIFRWRDLPRDAALNISQEGDDLAVQGKVPLASGGKALLWHRILRYNQLRDSWVILDRLSDTLPGPVAWAFHFAPGIRLEIESGVVHIQLPSKTRLVMSLDPPGEILIEPGWVSSRYGSREETQVLRRTLTGANESRIILAPESESAGRG